MRQLLFIFTLFLVAPILHAQEEKPTVSLAFDAEATGSHFFDGSYSQLPHLLFGVGYEEDFDWFRRAVLDSDYDKRSVIDIMETMEDLLAAIGGAFVKDITNIELTDISDDYIIHSSFAPLTERRSGVYKYSSRGQNGDISYQIALEFRFPKQTPVVNAVHDSENYMLYLDEFEVRAGAFNISSSNASLRIPAEHASLAFGLMEVEVEVARNRVQGFNIGIEEFTADLEGVLTESEKPIEGRMAGEYAIFGLEVDSSGSYTALDAWVRGADMETNLLASGVHADEVEDYSDSYTAVTIIRKVGGALSGLDFMFLSVFSLMLMLGWRQGRAAR